MAVVTLFMSDRDQSKTFSDKKEADQYDKMLELAENVSAWFEQSIKGLSEQQIEALGMLVAQNKDTLAQAIKGKPEVLLSDDGNKSDINPMDEKPKNAKPDNNVEKLQVAAKN